MIMELFKKIDNEEELTRDDIKTLLALEQQDLLESLFSRADIIRQKYVGNDVHLRGLIEFSNICRKNCRYCGIRSGNSQLKRYRMSIDDIVACAKLVKDYGYKTVVLQSGEDPFYSVDILVDLIQKIKQETNLAITLSIGERKREEYQQLFAAGADRFLLRFETSNLTLYQSLHPDSDFNQRIQCLIWLKEIGFQVGSGVMVGLPGQTLQDLAQDIIKFKELDLDMIGIGPYISHPDTPLAGSANGTVAMTLKVIALTRIVTRNTHIPATTALATLSPEDGREKALQAGANVVMPNITPIKYRELYDLYPNKTNEAANSSHNYLREKITKIGRSISTDYGHSLKKFPQQ